jgi:hypothetical protein
VGLQHALGVGEVPSVSATWADGRKKISVLMSATLTSPLLTSGAFFQKVALSCSQLSLTTSHSSLRIAARSSFALSEVAGFWPTSSMPFTRPSFMATNIGRCE